MRIIEQSIAAMRLKFHYLPELASSAAQPEMAFFALLEQIHLQGSLLKASTSLELSYRHAWGLIKQWEQQLGETLVNAQRGQGASLSAYALALVSAEHKLRSDAQAAFEALNTNFEAELRSLGIRGSARARAPVRPIRISASQDELFFRFCRTRPPDTVMVERASCLEALEHLHDHRIDMAGFAVSEDYARGSLGHAMLRRWLKADVLRLVQVAQRDIGLAFAPEGTPVLNLKAVARAKLRLVNRQRNSSIRWALEAAMEREGVSPKDLRGFDATALSMKDAVAALQAGEGDFTVMTRAQASLSKLRFTKLTHETYWLAYRAVHSDAPWLAWLAEQLALKLKGRISSLKGYNVQHAGDLMYLDDAVPWAKESADI
jgi:putative molybdopterin biosynthesis protein